MKKTITEQPTGGQFIEIWLYLGELYSDTYKWIDGELHRHSDRADEDGGWVNQEEDYYFWGSNSHTSEHYYILQ